MEPKGIPPIYQPGIVADAIIYAAEHPVPEVVVGGVGKGLILLQKIAPRLVDAALLRMGFSQQRTDRPKSEQAPDALYVPLAGYDRSEGDQTGQSKPASLYTWLAMHRSARAALAGLAVVALVGSAAFLRRRDGG